MAQKKDYDAIKDGVMESFLTLQEQYDRGSITKTRYIVYDAIYKGVYDAITDAIKSGNFNIPLQKIKK